MQWTYLLLLSTSSLVSAFKMNVSKMAAIMNQTVFRAFKKAYPSYLARLFLFAACLPPKALKSRFRSKAVLHPSLFPSTNISLISNGVFNLVQSSPSDPPDSFHENAAKHQKLDINRWKDPCVVFHRIDKILLFIHLTLALNKVSRWKKHVVPCRFRAFKSNLRNFLSQFFAETSVFLKWPFACKFALFQTMDI